MKKTLSVLLISGALALGVGAIAGTYGALSSIEQSQVAYAEAPAKALENQVTAFQINEELKGENVSFKLALGSSLDLAQAEDNTDIYSCYDSGIFTVARTRDFLDNDFLDLRRYVSGTLERHIVITPEERLALKDGVDLYKINNQGVVYNKNHIGQYQLRLFYGTPHPTYENRGEYVNVFLDRNGKYDTLSNLVTLHYWNNGVDEEIQPYSYPTITNKEGANTLWLAHYRVRKDVLVGSHFQFKMYDVYNTHLEFPTLSPNNRNATQVDTYDSGKNNIIFKLTSNSSHETRWISYESEQLSKEVALRLFETVDPCSDDVNTGWKSFENTKKYWNLEAQGAQGILGATTLFDHNHKGEAPNPSGNVVITALEKYQYMKEVWDDANPKQGLNLVMDNKVFTGVLISGVALLAISGAAFLIARRRKIVK